MHRIREISAWLDNKPRDFNFNIVGFMILLWLKIVTLYFIPQDPRYRQSLSAGYEEKLRNCKGSRLLNFK